MAVYLIESEDDYDIAFTTSGNSIKGYYTDNGELFTDINGNTYHVSDSGDVIDDAIEGSDEDEVVNLKDYKVFVHLLNPRNDQTYFQSVDVTADSEKSADREARRVILSHPRYQGYRVLYTEVE